MIFNSLAKRCTRNLVVKDSKLKGTQKVGALIGFVAENQVKVLNCRVEGVEINNHDIANESGSTAGLIGCIAYRFFCTSNSSGLEPS